MGDKTSRRVHGLTLDRLKNFTDGVLAIVITLLVLGINIPEGHNFSEQGLAPFLWRLKEDVIMYAASFWLIAAYWVQHHAVFQYLRYCNRTLMWLNILFLFPITLIPFLTKLKVVYRTDEQVVIPFGAAFMASGLILLGIWRYVISHPELLEPPDLDPSVVRSMTRRILMGPVISVAAVCLSFLDIDLGTIAFCTIPLFYLSHPLIDSGWKNPDELSD